MKRVKTANVKAVEQSNQFLGTESIGRLMGKYAVPCIISLLVGALYNIVDQIFIANLLIAEALVGAAAFVLTEAFPKQLIFIFGAANESSYYTEFAIKAFRIYLCMIIMACINKAVFIFLQAMGKAAASTGLSMLREVVFGVGFAVLLPLFWGLDGVLLSMPISDILTFMAAVILIFYTYKELSCGGPSKGL